MSANHYWMFILSWLIIYWIGFNKSFFHSLALASATAFIFVSIIAAVKL